MTLDRLLSRDRLVISVVLAALTVLFWVQMIAMPNEVPAGPERLMPCCGARFEVTLSMWVVMMAAMMIPSVAPMVLVHAAIMRRRVARGAPFVSSGLFLLGYLVAWSGFSALAALAQWGLFRTTLFDAHTLSIRPLAGGLVLLLAGAFQLSPAKDACLSQCRAPLGYFMTEWREGPGGALLMGLHHGLFCIGCCWLLMAVLFAVGIMNILWSALITALVVAEKVLPWPRVVVWSGAASCLLGGAALLGRASLGW